MVGGVIVGEDGPVLREDVEEMNSADLYGPGQVMVGYMAGFEQSIIIHKGVQICKCSMKYYIYENIEEY